jgi:hypothetical protein
VPSGRTHSRYRRRLADVAVGGRRLVIALTARRLFCDQPACQRRTFAEEVPGRTAAQGHGLRAIARHLGWGRHTVQR